MLRLTALLFPIAATATAGAAVVAALIMGANTWQELALFAGVGTAVGLPLSFGVAKALA